MAAAVASRLKKRDWTDARLKVEAAGGVCRVCGKPHAEAAHTIGRKHDRQVAPNLWWVDPDDIVPLCGPATSSDTCHGKYDAHQLDLLPYLSLGEQVAAVRAAGSITAAFRRVTGGRIEPAPAPELPEDVDPLDHRGQISGQTELGWWQ